jgi:serine/threonine-protein kinase
MDMSFDEQGKGGPAKARSGSRLQPGVTLNERYQIDEFLGPRAYGELYRGRDLSDGRLVSIKAIQPMFLADQKIRQKLEREIQIAVQLDHKNIGSTYGLFGAMVGSDAVAYLAAEFVDGQTLSEMVEKKRAAGRTFSLKGTYNVVAHLCNALVYAHGATLHGGLSPETVLVNSAGRVKVVDFGLARTLRPLENLQAQAAAGGLASLAPEMATQPDRADARADIYSVGVILFELLCGRPPTESFERPSVVVPGVPRAVDEVVEKCLRPLPDERYPDAQALKEALQRALAGELESPAANASNRIAPQPPAPQAPMSSAPPPPRASTPPPAGRPPTPAPGALPQPPQSRPATPAPGVARPSSSPQGGAAPVVPKSFNVDSALSAVDDSTERWLIQKDKLDFGPFNMRDVRSQIESGKIVGEHTIVDTETGERRKVKDHPQLRQLVMEADTARAEQHRLAHEQAEKSKHRGKVTTLLGAMFLVLAAAGGGIFWYFKQTSEADIKKKEAEAAKLAAEAKAEETAAAAFAEFLSHAEFTMKVDPPPPKKPGGHHRVKGKNGQWSDVSNLGDASGEGGDETLSGDVVQGVMRSNFKVLVGCIMEEKRRNSGLRAVDMEFIIKGTGNVSAVKVNGKANGAFAECMYGKMQSVPFPKFNGAKTVASFSMNFK